MHGELQHREQLQWDFGGIKMCEHKHFSFMGMDQFEKVE